MSTTTESRVAGAHAPQQEKLLQREARAPQQRVAPDHHNQRKPSCSKEDPGSPAKNKERNMYISINKALKQRNPDESVRLWVILLHIWLDEFFEKLE